MVDQAAEDLGVRNILEKYPYEMSADSTSPVPVQERMVTNPALILADDRQGRLTQGGRYVAGCFSDYE